MKIRLFHSDQFTIRVLGKCLLPACLCAVAVAELRAGESPLPADLLREQAQLTALLPQTNAAFGNAMAMQAKVMVVGAPGNAVQGAASAGVGYVYSRHGSNWILEAKLMANDFATGGQFGSSVAVSGETIVASAPGSGAAYIFIHSGSRWMQQAKLVPPASAASSSFASSTAIDGNTVVVGSPRDPQHGTNAGAAYVFVRNGTNWSQQAKLVAGETASGDLFGSSVTVSGQSLAVGAPGRYEPAGGTKVGAAYIFVRSGTNWMQQSKVLATGGRALDAFGSAVALSTNLLVVGATGDDERGTNVGAAYIFSRSGSTWTEQAKVFPETRSISNAAFGGAVAIDGQQIAVGAAGASQGFVNLFGYGTLNGWNITDRSAVVGSGLISYSTNLTSVQRSLADDLGWRYSITSRLVAGFSGGNSINFYYGVGAKRFLVWLDLDSSGRLTAFLPGAAAPNTIVLSTNSFGSTNYHTHAILGTPGQSEATYYFDGVAMKTWTGEAISALGVSWGSGSTAGDGSMNIHSVQFEILRQGTIVADYNAGLGGTPVPDPISLGWSLSNSSTTTNVASGPAPSDGSPRWVETASLPGAQNTQFGAAVALSEGWLGSGSPAAMDDGYSGAGSVTLFQQQSGASSPQTTLPKRPTLFANSVACVTNLAVVGASEDDDWGDQSGAAYVYMRTATQWREQTRLVAADGAISNRFGFSVAASDDLIVAGAPLADGNTNASGAAYVFSWNGTEAIQQAKLSGLDAASSNRFGHSVSVNADRILVGAPGTNSRGAAYVFALNSTNWVQQAKLSGSLGGTNDHFGTAVSLDSDSAIVGAPDEAPSAAGAAYVFTRNGSQWLQQARLGASDASSGDHFGTAVSISGDTAVVGAELVDDLGLANAGAAYVFVRTGSSWSQQARLTPSDASAGKGFGKVVVLRGENLVIGAEGDAANAGAAYLFVRNGTNWFQRRKITASDAAAGSAFGAAIGLSGETILLGAPHRDANRGGAYVLAADYSDPAAVAQQARRMLYYQSADDSGYFSRDRCAFRYLAELYATDSSDPAQRVRAQLENITSLFGPAEGARADEALSVLRNGLAVDPNNSVLADLLLDVYHDRTVAETIISKNLQAAADRARLGPPSTPGGFVIDDEIVPLEEAIMRNRSAMKYYFELLGDTLGQTGATPSGYIIFRQRVPMRALTPAQYLTTNGTLRSVVTNRTVLAAGYKDLVLLFDLLRHHGRSVVPLARFLLARHAPGDLDTARALVDDAEKFITLHGDILLGIFPDLNPVEGDGSGLAESIDGWRQTSTDLHLVRQDIERNANSLGFDSDFMMLVQKFSDQSGDTFDSYDALQVRLSPADPSSPLGFAKVKLQNAIASYDSYRGYQDQLQSQLNDITGAAEDRLREIVGVRLGEAGYDKPEENVGSEMWQQRQSINVAGLNITRNGLEISNLNQQIQIEIGRALSVSNAVIDYGNRQSLLTLGVGLCETVQEVCAITGGLSTDPSSATAVTASSIVSGIAGVTKAFLEKRKEWLAALEQAEIGGLESAAQVKTLLLGMSTLEVDSQETALLLQQEQGRLAALYHEKSEMERTIAESDSAVADRYFADPIHRLRSQHDTMLANLSFDEAQKWLFFMARALEYKWNTPFTNYLYLGKRWSTETLFKLRNAEELELFYNAMIAYESQIQLPKDDYFDWFSVREDFFGYKRTNNLGQLLFYVDPATGESVNAIEAFRRRLRRLQDAQGNVLLDFNTVREVPGGTFFRGPRFNAAGQVISKGLFMDKIRWMKINLPGTHTHGRTQLAGELTYGGTSFIRNFDVGHFVPDRPDRLQDEMMAYSTRFWFFHAPSSTWRFSDALSSPVTMQLSADPRVPPTVQQIDIFKERSVATTGWKLTIPTRDLGQTVLDINELDDVELYFYHYAVTRL